MSQLLLKSSSTLKYADAPSIEVKADANGRITGYGSTFLDVDHYGERVIAGAFAKTLADHRQRGTMPKMLWQHDNTVPIGKWLEMREDGRGLYVVGQLNLKTTNGKDAYEHLLAGDVDGMSIGYREKKVKPGTPRDLLELDLFEISIVTFPANREAMTETVKSFNSKAELVDMLREGGLSKSAAQLVAAGGWKALSKENEIDTDEVTRLAAAIDRATQALKGL
ncbi:hypothetical protein C8J33_1011983 [Rhizobium sp. PP-CC-3G-465]|nr:hypothetical protein C8J33_1011983 [Rhizobium sp. PP-CC-3G-465]